MQLIHHGGHRGVTGTCHQLRLERRTEMRIGKTKRIGMLG